MRWLGQRVVERPRRVWTMFLFLAWRSACGAGMYSGSDDHQPDEPVFAGRTDHPHLPLAGREPRPAGADGSRRPFRHAATKLTLLERLELVEQVQQAAESPSRVGSVDVGRHVRARPVERAARRRASAACCCRRSTYQRCAEQATGGPSRRLDPATPTWPTTPRTARNCGGSAFAWPPCRYRLWRLHRRHSSSTSSPWSKHERQQGATGLLGRHLYRHDARRLHGRAGLLDGLVNSFFGAFAMIAAVMSRRVSRPARRAAHDAAQRFARWRSCSA